MIERERQAFLPCRSCHEMLWNRIVWPIVEDIHQPRPDRLDVEQCREMFPDVGRPIGRDGVAWNWWSAGLPPVDWRTIALICPPGWLEILPVPFPSCTKWLTNLVESWWSSRWKRRDRVYSTEPCRCFQDLQKLKKKVSPTHWKKVVVTLLVLTEW